jgi:hypothetical protein
MAWQWSLRSCCGWSRRWDTAALRKPSLREGIEDENDRSPALSTSQRLGITHISGEIFGDSLCAIILVPKMFRFVQASLRDAVEIRASHRGLKPHGYQRAAAPRRPWAAPNSGRFHTLEQRKRTSLYRAEQEVSGEKPRGGYQPAQIFPLFLKHSRNFPV